MICTSCQNNTKLGELKTFDNIIFLFYCNDCLCKMPDDELKNFEEDS